VPLLKKLWVIIDLPNSNLWKYVKCALGVNVDLSMGKTLATDSSSLSEQRQASSTRCSAKEGCKRPRLQKSKASLMKIWWLHLQPAEQKLPRSLP
jgi:hypothetical protein